MSVKQGNAPTDFTVLNGDTLFEIAKANGNLTPETLKVGQKIHTQDDNVSHLKISGNTIAFDYNISAEPSYQWWVLYRGVMPDWANLNENKEKWDWISSNSKTDRQGKVQFDYEFTPGAIYTLALFKDQTENAYDLANYIELCVPPQDDNVSHLKFSGNTIAFDYNISAEPSYQWWVLYRGVMPDWANLNENKEKWDWISSNSKTDRQGKVQFDYEFTPGAIYTLALFKDQTENAYDLADYMEFCVQPQDDNVSHLKISGNRITFDYNISAEPSYQWWVLYRGVMPDWANLNENKEKWDWISSNSKTDRQGKVQVDYAYTPGAIYTLALFKDQTENAYDLAYYIEFRVQPQDDNVSHLKFSGNTIAFDYNISAEPSYQWWVLYRGVMPDWANLNENKEKWDWISSNSKTDRQGKVQFDYEYTPGAIYTLALFKDQTENAYDLADYIELCVPPQDDNVSHLKFSGNTIAFDYNISAEPSYQWWVLYRGVMPDWANLNENKEKWDWISSNSKTDRQGKVQFDYEYTPGAIYTLALFKDQTENAYDLADYIELCVPPQDDNVSHLKFSGNTIAFDYNISAEPSYQWWVLYRGVMPDWANLNENKEKWDWISSNSKTDRQGKVQFDYAYTPGAIYTLALFKDQTENAYDLADYMEFLGGEQDNNADHSGWIELHGDNSYCYCACSSAADNKQKHDSNNKQKHDSNKTMNVKEGAPYLYAVLTKDDDSIDFPTGAILTIEGPDGTKYDRDIEEENQLVIMSDSSVRSLIIKDPKPGDWKMTMTVPEGVGYHCECNTVPSKDPYKTITTTLSKTNQLQKRGLDDVTITGWLGAAATGATIGATIGTAGGPLGVLVGAVVGEAVGNVTYIMTHTLFPPSPTPTLQTATNLGQAAQTLSVEMSTPPTPQNGTYNLLMAERPATIYPNLINYNRDLTHPGRNPNSFPVEMTRHHIIPYNQLRRFWNRMVQEGHLTNAPSSLFNRITNLLEQSNLLTNFTLNEADRQQAIQLLEDIRHGNVTHDANSPTPNGWDSLQQVYAWMPGNLFFGPGGDFRTGDPGEEFEGDAGSVVGENGFAQYENANDLITQYDSNHGRGLAQDIARILGNIARRRSQPFALNSANWYLETSTGKYRLRRLP